jgi:DNA-directed RNA polymerase subunit K
MEQEFTRYEVARILGARALQISMDAPLLLKLEKEDLEKTNYDPLKIAELEFKDGVLPISVRRPLPVKKDAKLKREQEGAEEDKDAEKKEAVEEKEIKEGAEIMELAQPEDEADAEEASEAEEV